MIFAKVLATFADMRQLNHDPRAITRHRENAGLTRTALAEKIGCSLSLVSEIESGTRNARDYLLERMADVFGCPVSRLQSAYRRQRKTAPAADGPVSEVRDSKRSDGAADMPELRSTPVSRSA